MLETLHIESTGVPIYVQIRDRMLKAIAAGEMKPGERLPTMREVAVALKVDLNTVRRAYDALARAGAITVLPARGSFVADRPPAADPGKQAADIDDLAYRTIGLATARGIDPADIARRILAVQQRKDQTP